MTHTYHDTLTTDRDKVRLYAGDTQTDKGPRPDNRNFSDGEIAFILTEEDGRVNGAVAHCFEILANEWAAWAISEREGEAQIDAKGVAEEFRKQAAIWRKKPGGADTAERGQSLVTLTRYDAYTEAAEGEYS
jgi:hypothetical protein